MVCDMLHCLVWIYDRGAPLHPLIYLIIIGCCADLCSVRRGGGIWYRLNASGRVYALQRVAGGIIAACAGLVLWAVERVQSQETPL